MGKYADYRDAVFLYASKKAIPKTKAGLNELDQNVINQALGEPHTTRSVASLSKKERFLSKLFHGLLELHSSIERLETFEIYISRFPYSNTDIKKSQHLRHVIESYLHEFYILKERTNAYITTIGRSYRGDSRHTAILNKTRPLFVYILKIFDNLLQARGVHVHQSRYTEPDLERLDTLELFKTLGTDADNAFEALYIMHYKDTRNKWKKTIKINNEGVTKVFDVIFETLFSIVLTNNGNVKYPRIKRT